MAAFPFFQPVTPIRILLMNVPDHLRYTSDHEWISLDGDVVTVGITDHAQEELTDVVFVELPENGRSCDAGEGID